MFGLNAATARAHRTISATPPPIYLARSARRVVSALALALPRVKIAAMTLHLAEISAQVALGAQAVITLDGAGWHRSGGALVVPENISLLLCSRIHPS